MAKKSTLRRSSPGDTIGKLLAQGISEEIQRSYLDYAMSVIVSRALPDVRDGLKPVARRILYSMWRLGIRSTSKFRKSAHVVGDVMARYHPHGDIPIYDSLARLTQEFSMRYQLIEGQGNWGCFTGDTKVQLADGRSVTFRQLIKEQREGKRHWTFSFNQERKRIEITEVRNPRLTKKNASLVEVTLDSGAVIRCTPDHRFMLRDGTYREAQHLQSGDSLMPLYTHAHDGSRKNLKGYTQLLQPAMQEWDFVHHLADEWNLSHNVYNRARGRVRHHKDFNKKNNSPDNIQRMHWGEHWRLHAALASWRHKHDPEYVEELTRGRERYIEHNRQALSKRTSERNRKMWKNAAYRETQIARLKAMWEDDTYREFMRAHASASLKRLWQDPAFQGLMSRSKSKEMRKRWKNATYRKSMSRHMGEISRHIWSDLAHREFMSRRMKEIAADPQWRRRQRAVAKALWGDSQYRAHYPENHFSRMAKQLWKQEYAWILHSKKAKRQWNDRGFRLKLIAAVKQSNRRRLQDSPDMMEGLAGRAAAALRKKWKNEGYKGRIIRSKILRHVKTLVEKHGAVTPEIYEQERTANGVPKIGNTVRHFESFDAMIEAAKRYNHSVVSVRLLRTREDVYDITVDPWHNFALGSGVFVHNSVDGDPPAAMRYTEARLAKVADEMLTDIEKDTVDFVPNYDGTRQEPVVLPSRLPQFLINGTVGIAVGMATSVPPHNLKEVCQALTHLIDHPKATVDDLLKFVSGPDFPTGAAIYDKREIAQVYATGKGSIVARALADIEEGTTGHRIVVRQLPYLVNKANLLAKIAEGVKGNRLAGIRDLRDESDKDGIRIVIELKKDAYPKKVLNQLFASTDLQRTFHVNMLALVEEGRQPKVLTLKEALEEHIKHRQKVVTRRTKFDLDRAMQRAHILEGLKKALDHINEVIATIKKSATREVAHANLRKQFRLSEAQATAILEMRLQTLAGLERKKVDDELEEKKKLIEELTAILADPKKVLGIIKEEYAQLEKEYGDERRTRVFAQAVGDFAQEDLVPDEPAVVIVTRGGYIKRLATATYHVQRRGGKGVRGMTTKEEDMVDIFLATTTHKELLFFTNQGRVFATKAYEIPAATTRAAKGQALQNFLELGPQEKVTAVQALPAKEDVGEYLVMATRQGLIKKTFREEFQNIRRSGLKAITLKEGDTLEWVATSSGKDQIILFSKEGQAIRFHEKDVRSMGRTAAGVRGMRLKKGDEIVAMHVIPTFAKATAGKSSSAQEVLVVTEEGFGKRTPLGQYRLQKRGGSGIKTAKVTAKTGRVVNAAVVDAARLKQTDVLIISRKGQVIRVEADSISQLGRATQGVRVMRPTDKSGKVAMFTTWGEE